MFPQQHSVLSIFSCALTSELHHCKQHESAQSAAIEYAFSQSKGRMNRRGCANNAKDVDKELVLNLTTRISRL